MHDRITAAQKLGDPCRISDIANNQFKSLRQPFVTSGEIVINNDVVSLTAKNSRGVAADVPGATYNENGQAILPGTHLIIIERAGVCSLWGDSLVPDKYSKACRVILSGPPFASGCLSKDMASLSIKRHCGHVELVRETVRNYLSEAISMQGAPNREEASRIARTKG
jgi:hypothetical protein